MAKNDNNWIIFVMGLAAAAGAADAPEWALPVPPPVIEPLYALVDVDALNLRDAPAVDADKIGLLHRGERVEVLAWAVGFDQWESDYVWAEVRAGDLHGYVAAEESNYDWWGSGERYLAVEHDFGEPELSLTADLDADGSPERVYVGPGEIHADYEQFYYEEEYVYRLPLVLRVEGSFDAEVRLEDFFLGTSDEEVPAEELIAGLEESGKLGCYHHWSLYGLEADDFNVDGAVELQLTLDARSGYPSPVGNPSFTHRRVQGFTPEDDGLRRIYGYTERAFLRGYDEDGPDGGWTYVEGGAELTPEVLNYRTVTACPEDRVPSKRFRPMEVDTRLDRLDWVRRPLPPPNYLADARWFVADLEARWVPDAGFYALHCPPGNDYGRGLGYAYPRPTPLDILGTGAEERYGLLKEPLTLYCLPGSEEVAGTLEPGMWVRMSTFDTRDGDWSVVARYDSDYEPPPLDEPYPAGWTRTPPKMEE